MPRKARRLWASFWCTVPAVKRVPLTLAAVVVFACAAQNAGRTRLADGSYHVSCKEPLYRCLAAMTDLCSRYGYDVVRAKEEKKHYGPSLWEAEYVSSDAIVRCREPEALIGGKSPPPVPASSGLPPASAKASRCFPGSTQSCLGPGACKGAQTCREDGAMFGACDCGPASAGPPEVPLDSSDAGPPATWAIPDGGAPR